MDILKNFGVDPVLLGAQVINFLILFYIMKRFLYKPLLEMLKKREGTIKEGLKNAEEARILLEKTAEKEKEVLRRAQEETKKMIALAREKAEVTAKEAEERSKKHADKVIAETKEQLQKEAKETEARITRHVSEIAVKMLERALTGMVDKKEQNEIMEKVAKKIKPGSN